MTMALLLDLIETNIRQRGDVSSSSLKMGRIIQKLEEIYNIRNGRPEKTLAEQLNMSVDNLNNYKKLTTLIPELQDLVDDKVSFSVASRVIAKLSQEEQEQLLVS